MHEDLSSHPVKYENVLKHSRSKRLLHSVTLLCQKRTNAPINMIHAAHYLTWEDVFAAAEGAMI